MGSSSTFSQRCLIQYVDMNIKSILQEAEAFIGPAISREAGNKSSSSIIDQIVYAAGSGLPASEDISTRLRIIQAALTHLKNVHTATDLNLEHVASTDILNGPQSRRIVQGLIDLVILEGIYPALSPGVGVPIEKRLKTVLKGGLVAIPSAELRIPETDRRFLLTQIVDELVPIVLYNGPMSILVKERMMVDLIAALGDLAYSPFSGTESRDSLISMLDDLLKSTSAINLYPLLMSLLHPSCPAWFQQPISASLSLLPLRSDGIRQSINFIASTAPPLASKPEDQSVNEPKPHLSLECLAQASRILTAVPSLVSADTYFTALAPQLLQLLDDSDLDNKRVASYIIGTGILSRRKIGAPGTIGWKLFAQPILNALNLPAVKTNSSDYVHQHIQSSYDGLALILDTEQALQRLSSLVLFHPNPGLVKRLVSSTFVSLWSFGCFADETGKSTLAEQAWKILVTFCKISGDSKVMVCLGENLLTRGGPDWEYFKSIQGKIGIRPHSSNQELELDATTMMQIVDCRTEKLMDLIKSAVLDDSQVVAIADHFSSQWLNIAQSGSHETLQDNEDIKDPLNRLLGAKITQGMFEEYRGLLATNPSSILKLVHQIVASFTTDTKAVLEKEKNTTEPSIFGLGEIISSEQTSGTERDEFNAAISIALSLLSALISSPEFSLEAVPDALFQNLRRDITTLSSYRASLPDSLIISVANVAAMLEFEQHNIVPSRSNNEPGFVHQIAADRTTYRTALAYLTDTLIPVRAQGLSMLTSLVSEGSPILDIQATVTLLLSLLQDEDEYIYLSSIKTIGLLGSKHPGTVIRMLVEKYADVYEESTLDTRIKVGEALLKTVEHLGVAIPQETTVQLGNTMITVASRRANRTKEMADRKRVKKEEERARKRAENVWGEDLPSVDEDDPSKNANQSISRIIEGWADTGHEEDIRIRTSALSILGIAIETNAQNLGPTILSAAVDCAIAILKLETTAERAILRRAGAMVIGSIIKALDAAEEKGQSVGVGFEEDNIVDIIAVLEYIEATDTDEMVVGHLGILIENLKKWREKLVLGLYKSGEDSGIRFGLENERLAGLAIDPGKPTGGRPKIEEVD